MPQNIYINNDENRGVSPQLALFGIGLGLAIGTFGGFKCAREVYNSDSRLVALSSEKQKLQQPSKKHFLMGKIKDIGDIRRHATGNNEPIDGGYPAHLEFYVTFDPSEKTKHREYEFACFNYVKINDMREYIDLSKLLKQLDVGKSILIEIEGIESEGIIKSTLLEENTSTSYIYPDKIIKVGEKVVNLEDLFE